MIYMVHDNQDYDSCKEYYFFIIVNIFYNDAGRKDYDGQAIRIFY